MAYDRDYGRDTRSSYRSDQDQRSRDSGRWGREQGRGGGDDDRGFFDRAGDEVRSWFGDEEAERRRERDAREDDRYEDRGRAYGSSQGYGQGSRAYGPQRTSTSRYAGSNYGGGSGWRSGERERSRERSEDRDWSDYPRYSEYGISGGERDYGRSSQGQQSYGGGWSGQHHDQNYSRWRDQQMRSLDRDYDEYQREKQSQFDTEFGAWRTQRQGQRSSLGRVSEHMEVVGSDGEHVGTVDKVRGDRIILTKSDPESGGMHHSIPCSWIDRVDERVTINKSADEAQRMWRDEERNRAMFGREEDERRGEGAHMLNRSFSGTYER